MCFGKKHANRYFRPYWSNQGFLKGVFVSVENERLKKPYQ